jgi:hypothetical protein
MRKVEINKSKVCFSGMHPCPACLKIGLGLANRCQDFGFLARARLCSDTEIAKRRKKSVLAVSESTLVWREPRPLVVRVQGQRGRPWQRVRLVNGAAASEAGRSRAVVRPDRERARPVRLLERTHRQGTSAGLRIGRPQLPHAATSRIVRTAPELVPLVGLRPRHRAQDHLAAILEMCR